MPVREISIANRYARLKFDRRAVVRAVRLLDAHRPALRVPPARTFPGELSLVFLSDAALARLHADFLNDPSPTDVITFEGEPALGADQQVLGPWNTRLLPDLREKFFHFDVRNRLAHPFIPEGIALGRHMNRTRFWRQGRSRGF